MNQDKNNVLLTIIGTATLLVALVGATFAYFSAAANNDNAQSFSVTTTTVGSLVYTGTELSLSNTQPGESVEGTFTVENPSDSPVDLYYTLKLVIDTNTFSSSVNSNQLILTLSGTGTTTVNVVNKTIDLTDGDSTAAANKTFTVVSNQYITIGETQTYTATLSFKELNTEQDENQGKEFSSHIEISGIATSAT